MKLNYFSEQTFPKQFGSGVSPKVSLTKNGVISINNNAVALMGLADGTKISIAQDEEDPLNWYLFKDPTNGFTLRFAADQKNLVFNHRGLVRKIVESHDLDVEITHSCLIASQATTITGSKTQYWGLIPVKK